MISANGGSFSDTNPEFNNVTTAFKFQKNDIITCDYDSDLKQISFTKNKNKESYKLDLEKTDEQINICVLFYYPNNEVEFTSDSGLIEKIV